MITNKEIKTRTCTICKHEKILNRDFFHKDKSRYLGFMYTCIECEKDRTKSRYEKNKRLFRYGLMSQEEKNRKILRAKEWRKTQKGRAINLLSAYKKFDKKHGYDFDLSVEWVINEIFNKKCIYCHDENSPLGCDRIDNKIGHIKSNVVPCCKECNVSRMDNFTHEEMLIIGQSIMTVKNQRIKK